MILILSNTITIFVFLLSLSIVFLLCFINAASVILDNNLHTALAFPPIPNVPPETITKNVIISINPGASDKSSQNPYSPLQVTVPVGTIVTWKNNDPTTAAYPDDPHTITSGDPEKGPSNIFYSHEMYFPGGEFTITFHKPGVYPYYDRNYPHMKGQVIVTNNTQ